MGCDRGGIVLPILKLSGEEYKLEEGPISMRSYLRGIGAPRRSLDERTGTFEPTEVGCAQHCVVPIDIARASYSLHLKGRPHPEVKRGSVVSIYRKKCEGGRSDCRKARHIVL